MGFDINRSAIRPRLASFKAVAPRGDRLTECKICPDGIYASESRIWASRVMPSMASGLVHCRCADSTPGTITAGSPTVGGERKYRT